MELLKEIDDNEVGGIEKNRKAARGIFFDKENLMPILFVSKYNYHKIPGGGVENDEELESALRREIFEETGCEVEVAGEVGKIIEYRKKWNLKQESFCYYGKIIKKGEVSFTEEEVGHGFVLKWLKLEDATKIVKFDKPENYEGKMIQQRDLIFLERYKDILNNLVEAVF